MDASEYIDAVTAQIGSKRARAMVAKELSDHIADQTDDYLKAGMALKEAQEEAVRQMGDAVAVGMELDAIHRPRLDIKVLGIVGIFSLLACLLQMAVIRIQHANGWDYGSQRAVLLQVAAGVGIMVLILYMDYTFIGKHGLKLWAVFLLIPLVCKCSHYAFSGSLSDRVLVYLERGLFLPLFAGVVYKLRGKGWRGIAFSLLLLFLGGWIYAGALPQGSFSLVQNVFMCVLLIAYAVYKGWYPVSRAKGLAVLGTFVAGGAGVLVLAAYLRGSYSWMRLMYFLRLKNRNAYGLDGSSDYYTGYIRGILDKSALFGRPGALPTGYAGPHSSIAFLDVLSQVGIVGGVLIIVGLAVLCVLMAMDVSKQKNVLGGMIGAACILALFVPAILHCLVSLGVMIPGDALMPFLYPGWVANAVCYTLLGMYLSVYRNKDLLA